ncbi:MAG: ATP-binding protein [Eubacterium sp.]|nr:ATP-binding protein [Eubacterium sp.]
MDRVLFDVTERAEIVNVPVITDMVDAELEKLDASMKALMQINIAIDELFSNIAKYAYGDEGGDARVIMSFCEDRNEVSLTFMDSGARYDPTAQEDPDVTLPAEERGIGGLGILLVKKSMDGIGYEYKDGQNCLTIKKIIR